MILIELQPGATPTVLEVSAPNFLRFGVIEAFRAGDPIPISVDEAAAYLRAHRAGLWVFYSVDHADLWAEHFPGPQGNALRYAVQCFMTGTNPQPHEVANV